MSKVNIKLWCSSQKQHYTYTVDCVYLIPVIIRRHIKNKGVSIALLSMSQSVKTKYFKVNCWETNLELWTICYLKNWGIYMQQVKRFIPWPLETKGEGRGRKGEKEKKRRALAATYDDSVYDWTLADKTRKCKIHKKMNRKKNCFRNLKNLSLKRQRYKLYNWPKSSKNFTKILCTDV